MEEAKEKSRAAGKKAAGEPACLRCLGGGERDAEREIPKEREKRQEGHCTESTTSDDGVTYSHTVHASSPTPPPPLKLPS